MGTMQAHKQTNKSSDKCHMTDTHPPFQEIPPGMECLKGVCSCQNQMDQDYCFFLHWCLKNLVGIGSRAHVAELLLLHHLM